MAWIWSSCVVTKVVDGDTLDAQMSRTVEMDFGFGLKPTMTLAPVVRLRLNRINTPPGYTDTGKLATNFVKQSVAAPVTIETFKPYKYGGPDTSPGEWMAEVTLPGGLNLSDELVKAGLAQYWDGEGPRPGG